jgi:molybdenum cofactor biosynthesis protein B
MAARRAPPKGRGKTGPETHRHHAHGAGSLGAAVITVSSTRTPSTDESGRILADLFSTAGHRVAYRAVVKDDIAKIRASVRKALATPGVDIVVTSGGTGMTPSDVTVEAVLPLLTKKADGWGDVFRAVSREEIGNAAMLSRSVAGTVKGKWVVCIPGSAGAARTAMTRLLLPELEHMVYEARR